MEFVLSIVGVLIEVFSWFFVDLIGGKLGRKSNRRPRPMRRLRHTRDQ
ncbi:hypothetical protein [Leifsonia sp. Leaf264]|nr:hypothetical protein [Leifsonia sp. Leaf264]